MYAINKFKIQVHSWYAVFKRHLESIKKILSDKIPRYSYLFYSSKMRRDRTKIIINLKQMARARNNLLVSDNLINGLVYIINYIKFNSV